MSDVLLEIEKYTKIAEDIYWLGSSRQINSLNTNIYLLVDGNEAVLFGAGPVVDFEILFSNLTEITGIEKIKFIVVQDYDPSSCSAIPLFEKNGFSGKIVAHYNISSLVSCYGIRSEIIYSNLSANRLFLESGRTIRFFNTPYLKSAGSFIAYDTASGVLFSGDLFGAFNKKWKLFADEEYFSEMKKFHAEFMPDSSMLHYVLQMIVKREFSVIAPRHGSVIKEKISEAVESLMNVKCGSFFSNLKFDINESEKYMEIINELIKHYYSFFSIEEVQDVFKGSGIIINTETGLLDGFDPETPNPWDHFSK